MCFYNDDYEWVARVVDDSDVVLSTPSRCQECGRTLEAGETVHNVFQQEHEECGACEDGLCDCPKDKDEECIDCECEDPDYGETFDYDRCQECDKFLKAVYEHEKDENCPPTERQPAYEMMIETISQFERENAVKYFRKAARMFPELKQSGYLKRLWRQMFELSFA